MVVRRLLALTAAILVCAGSARAAESTVVVISMDGVRHDYIDRGGLPGFERIVREGVRAEALVPVFPSKTFPSHVSMATGVTADVHGIVANSFYDRGRDDTFSYDNDASWIDAEPIWVTAERQGRRAAVFFWVGSETDWRGRGASLRVMPFDSGVSETEKVDRMLEWLDLPEAERPRLVMTWWHGADGAGHDHGPDADDVIEMLRGQDRELVRLLTALDEREAWPHTTLIIVSDHGMAAVEEIVDAGAVLREAEIEARVVAAGAVAHVFLSDPADEKAAVEALRAEDGVEAMATRDLPERLHYRRPDRVGDIVAMTEPPRSLRRVRSARGLLFKLRSMLGRTGGAHGYDPAATPEMRGIFVALGRGAPAGVSLPALSGLDVAPTIARLLSIDPPPRATGRAVLPPGTGRAPADIP